MADYKRRQKNAGADDQAKADRRVLLALRMKRKEGIAGFAKQYLRYFVSEIGVPTIRW